MCSFDVFLKNQLGRIGETTGVRLHLLFLLPPGLRPLYVSLILILHLNKKLQCATEELLFLWLHGLLVDSKQWFKRHVSVDNSLTKLIFHKKKWTPLGDPQFQYATFIKTEKGIRRRPYINCHQCDHCQEEQTRAIESASFRQINVLFQNIVGIFYYYDLFEGLCHPCCDPQMVSVIHVH